MNKLTSEFVVSIKVFVLMLIITGVLYTGVVMLLGNLLFPEQVRGSLVIRDQKLIGSKLIAQNFSSEKYFWARASASDYNAVPSSGSNLGPTSKDFKSLIETRIKIFSNYSAAVVPADLLSSSASGLDPDISVDSASYQLPRIAKARLFNLEQVEELKGLIAKHVQKRDCGFLGEERINVLELNLALYDIK